MQVKKSNSATRTALTCMIVLALAGGLPAVANAYQYSETNISTMYGWNKKVVFPTNDPDLDDKGDTFATDVTTIEHFSSTSYGGNYFFFDIDNFTGDAVDDTGQAGAEIYGEFTSSFSYNKLTGGDISAGPLTDVALAVQGNVGGGGDSRVGLVGPRFNFDVPGFNVFHMTAYWRNDFDAPDHTYQVTWVWNTDFNVGDSRFVFEGYIDYVPEGNGSNVFGSGEHQENSNGAPRFLLDVGNYWGEENKFLVGTEVQYWVNKFGSDEDELNPQVYAEYVF